MMSRHFKCDNTLSHYIILQVIYPGSIGDSLRCHSAVKDNTRLAAKSNYVLTGTYHLMNGKFINFVVVIQMQLESKYDSSVFVFFLE